MISFYKIKGFFPETIRNNSLFYKYMLKEYIQLMILDFLSTSHYIRKISFIGGTSIRLVKGIDRFSEDIDFDCKNLSEDEFNRMTDDVVRYLQNNGLPVVVKDKQNPKLQAFRRSLDFPEFLYSLGLSGHREERFLIKIESQDQGIDYNNQTVHIKGADFFFPMPVPPDEVLCSMKIAAMLDRQKGRDFYDVMFLLPQTLPDFDFLKQMCGIENMESLYREVEKVLSQVNLEIKKKDFEHLLFNKQRSTQILRFKEFIQSLCL